MKQQTQAAADHAYCPYSHFPVGAAILSAQQIYAGCNVENAAYGSSICAECNAITTAIHAGIRQMEAMLIYTPTDDYTFSCGNCRQVFNEFATPDAKVFLSCMGKPTICDKWSKDLLPYSFGPNDVLCQSQ